MTRFRWWMSRDIDDWANALLNKPAVKRLCYECGEVLKVYVTEYFHEGGGKSQYTVEAFCDCCESRYEIEAVEDRIYSEKFRTTSLRYISHSETRGKDGYDA